MIWTLSDKIGEVGTTEYTKDYSIHILNVKEFIRRLREDLDYYDNQEASDEFSKGFEYCCKVFRKKMDELAGSKLK